MEVTNHILLSIIKKRLEDSKGLWLEELPSILWAYRTTVRTPTGETPFLLVFVTEAVILVDAGITTYRTTSFNSEKNDEFLINNLDVLEEKRDEIALQIVVYKHRMTKYYNLWVKLRRFAVGDLVLKKVNLAT